MFFGLNSSFLLAVGKCSKFCAKPSWQYGEITAQILEITKSLGVAAQVKD